MCLLGFRAKSIHDNFSVWVTSVAHDNDSSWGFLLSWEGGEFGAIADYNE